MFDERLHDGPRPRLEPLYTGPRPRVDIVLVHGFHGHPTGTWTHEESNKCWPKDHVPDEMKAHIRVLTFAYNTSHTRPYRREELSDHSRGLLKRLNKCPQRRHDGLRPIVWVAHSAGGIIVKEALIIARHSRQFRDIFYSTYGVVFFATPHHSDGGSWSQVVSKIFDETPCFRFFGVKSDSRRLLDEDDAQGLDNIAQEFAPLSNMTGLRLVSFEEQPPMVVGHGPNELRFKVIKQLLRDHFDICKLDGGGNDLAYVWSIIQSMGDRSPETRGFSTLDLEALEWLGIAKMRSAQLQAFKPTEGTCAWIQGHSAFKDWQTEPGYEKLWIFGGIGSGKTYLAKHIVKHLGSHQDLAYCSLDDIKAGYKTATSVLVWLMYEILSVRRGLIANCLTGLYQERGSSNGDSVCDWPFPDVKQLWRNLVRALERSGGRQSRHPRVTIVLDGIDQCLGHQDQDDLSRLRKFFGCVTQDDAFRVLVFSRPSSDLSDIQGQPELGFVQFQIGKDDTKHDISKTVREAAGWIARSYEYDRKTEETIIAKVEGQAGGMYLWATTVLDEIKRQPLSASELEAFLNRLPSTIIELYDLILGRAGSPSTGNSRSGARGGIGYKFTRHVLFWIAYQLYDMNEKEMWTAVSLLEAIGLPQRDPTRRRRVTKADVRAIRDDNNIERDISRGCGALVMFTDDDTFAAAHPSVQQFLVTPTETLLRSYTNLRHHQDYHCGGLRPDHNIRQLCTDYLLLPFFRDPKNVEPCKNLETWRTRVRERVEKHPFSRYSALSWFKHASIADLESTEDKDKQRLLTPAADDGSGDWECSRSWMEIWWYYEKPGLDFPAGGVSPDTLRLGASLPPRLEWVDTPETDHTGVPATGSLASQPSPALPPALRTLPASPPASPPLPASRTSPAPPQQWRRQAPAPAPVSPSPSPHPSPHPSPYPSAYPPSHLPPATSPSISQPSIPLAPLPPRPPLSETPPASQTSPAPPQRRGRQEPHHAPSPPPPRSCCGCCTIL